MLLHTECADVNDAGANALLPVKLRLKSAPALFTRRFEAQLHWQAAEKRSLNLQVSSFKSQLPRIWPDFGGSDLSLVT